jgi:hypothetical protein
VDSHSYSTLENTKKKKHEIALHGLCITNHACAKDGFLLEAMKKSPSKDFAKNNSH